MTLNDALTQGEAGASAFEVHGVMLALEHHEQVLRLAQVEPGAVVLDVEHAAANWVQSPADFYARLLDLAGEFQRGALQVPSEVLRPVSPA